MNNKLIIASFFTFFCLAGFSQQIEINNDISINVYPNPAIELIYVDISDSHSKVNFELTSMIGTRVSIQPEKVGLGKYRFNLKGLSSGYYFILIEGNEERFRKSFKFLKR